MTNSIKQKKVKIYSKFERFWHWGQAFAIITMIVTAMEIKGKFNLFGFEQAVKIHNFAAWAWIVLIVLIFTWILTTGEWKQYLPTKNGLGATIKYYLSGLFKGEKHPHKKTQVAKLNPLQRVAYLVLLLILIPLQMTSGLLYFFYHDLLNLGFDLGRIDWIASIHSMTAYAIICFIIIHIYMITLGKTVFSHLKAMITGSEELD